MNLIHVAHELPAAGRKVCLAIGVFDGVHLGHQQVIRQTIADARQHEAAALAITFDCHPNSVVAPHRNPPLLYSLSQKLRVIETLGIDTTLLIHFDQAFSRIPAETFIRRLGGELPPIHSICVGSAFTFGHQRSGDVALLQALGREFKFIVHGLASVSLNGKHVSSTRIREAVREGDLDAASQMLGRTYSLAGEVIRGDQWGRQLGFPTANLDAAQLALPPNGVYAVFAQIHGTLHRAVANLGSRPTRQDPNPSLRVEVHVLDFSGDVYGQELEISFLQKLRDEQKFASPDALKQQIARDVAAAREIFD